MKKVSLYYTVEPKDGLYKLSLGNGYIYEFTQERKLKKFVADCESFLTDRMYIINEIYSDLFCSYRRLWGFFHNDKKTYRYKTYREEKEVRDSFEGCEQLLEQLWSKTVNVQTNVFVFHSLRSCLRELINVQLKLTKIVLNNPPEKIKLNHLLNQLIACEAEINAYQSCSASGIDKQLVAPIIELKIAN